MVDGRALVHNPHTSRVVHLSYHREALPHTGQQGMVTGMQRRLAARLSPQELKAPAASLTLLTMAADE
jgi:hypothetical protein